MFLNSRFFGENSISSDFRKSPFTSALEICFRILIPYRCWFLSPGTFLPFLILFILNGFPVKTDNDRAVLEMVEGAMKSGCIGLTFGRNVFQHDNPTGIVSAIAKIVYEGLTAEETLEVVKI